MKKLLFGVLYFLIAAMVVGWVYLRQLERQYLYHPQKVITTTPGQFGLRYQDVQFVAADGTVLTGWWMPANRPRGTVIYCSGNAGNIGANASRAPEFLNRGFNLLLWDYRGYGRSAGRPSEKGLYTDARAAYDTAAAMSGRLPIIVYGVSLGSAVAVQLAQDRSPAALITEAGFASAAHLAQLWYPKLPLEHFLSVSFNSTNKISKLPNLPKLIGHSPHDQTIPFPSARLLYAAAAPPKTFAILAGGHNDGSWFTPGAPGNSELETFLNQFNP